MVSSLAILAPKKGVPHKVQEPPSSAYLRSAFFSPQRGKMGVFPLVRFIFSRSVHFEHPPHPSSSFPPIPSFLLPLFSRPIHFPASPSNRKMLNTFVLSRRDAVSVLANSNCPPPSLKCLLLLFSLRWTVSFLSHLSLSVHSSVILHYCCRHRVGEAPTYLSPLKCPSPPLFCMPVGSAILVDFSRGFLFHYLRYSRCLGWVTVRGPTKAVCRSTVVRAKQSSRAR